jgi:hypothetical protein
VVFDESVFPFSSTPTTTPVPDPSSLFPADTVVQPPFPWSPAGTASPRSLPGTCPSSPAGPGPSSPGAAPTSPDGADPGPSFPDTSRGDRADRRAPVLPRHLPLPRHLLRGSLRQYGCASAGRGRRHSRSILRQGHQHHRRSPRRPVTHRRSTTRHFFTDTRGMFTRW